MQEKSVIITAGGLGKRMKSAFPKQFFEIITLYPLSSICFFATKTSSLSIAFAGVQI